jgi:hypothetical protein
MISGSQQASASKYMAVFKEPQSRFSRIQLSYVEQVLHGSFAIAQAIAGVLIFDKLL